MTPAQCRSYLRDLQRFGIKLGLGNITSLLASFRDPHRAYPSVHIAGTNGKGSVCAMLAEILACHGFRVGLYTSPHLVRVEERIRVNGRTIPPADFRRFAGAVKRRAERLLARHEIQAPPTFFEVLTVIGFLYFRERKADIVVLETGLGGRFDATNVVTPLVSVITNITLDHQEHLGGTIARIAFEKAGIIKPRVPVVSGVGRGAADKVLRERTAADEAPLVGVFDRDGDFTIEPAKARKRFSYRFRGETFRYSPGLRGEHQGRNAAVAIAAASVLGRVWRPLEKRKIIAGVERARWEGRLERVSRRPDVVLDGAHNEAGAAALRRYVERNLGRPPVLVFTIMKDKAVGRVARVLFPIARRVYLTSIPYPRAATPEAVLSRARPFAAKLTVEPDLGRAIAKARADAGRRGTVLITGSLFLVGEAKKILARKKKRANA